MHASNPGSPDIFGRSADSENTGFYCTYSWMDSKSQGTPLRMRVGFALCGDFGHVDVMGAAVVKHASQYLGLTNDTDCISSTFRGGYTLTPHRFQVDMASFRDRISGADTQSAPSRPGLGVRGQKTDSGLILGSWSGRLGPVRGLLHGNIVTGTARGGPAGRPTGGAPGRDDDSFGGDVVAYAEVALDVAWPVAALLDGSGDGDSTDNTLHGFMTLPIRQSSL